MILRVFTCFFLFHLCFYLFANTKCSIFDGFKYNNWPVVKISEPIYIYIYMYAGILYVCMVSFVLIIFSRYISLKASSGYHAVAVSPSTESGRPGVEEHTPWLE